MADKKHWQKVEAIVDKALMLPKTERKAFINNECQRDQTLKSEVTLLLDSISASEGWLENPVQFKESFYEDLAGDIKELSSGTSFIGQTVGAYVIREESGQGGMGSVYLAERSDGRFDHKVAIKIIKESVASDANVQRFKREQNILAGLNHPGIAKLFDGGVTEDGHPYLVMEYVDGIPIDEFCDLKGSSLSERIMLFKQILKAISHAHENLVIHRDLKPGNIFVTEDGDIKILDFGISKLLVEDETNPGLTQTKDRLLTPKYAAPEQIKQQPITTATDVYALGIIFYLLICGAHPFNLEGLTQYATEQTILHEHPSDPSKRVSGPFPINSKQLHGDLDAIALKAIRKEPEHRYSTVQSLLDDLKRYHAGWPVDALSGSWRYYAGKFIQRHRWGVGAAVASLVLVAGFIAAMVWQMQKTAQQRDRAVAVADFMKSVLSNSDPEKGQGGAMPVRQLLKKGSAHLDTSFINEPILKADLDEVMGSAFRGYGLYKEALRLHRKALALRLAESGPNSLAVANTHNNMGEAFYYLDQPDSAAAYYQKSLRVRRRLLGEHHIKIAQSLNNLALLDALHENYTCAAKRMEKALSIFQDRLPNDHWRIANVLNNLATIHSDQGKLQEAEHLFRQAMAMHIRVKGEMHRDVARTQGSLGNILVREGKIAEAERMFTEALRRARASTTSKLPIIGEILIGLGKIRLLQKNYTEAEHYFRKAHTNYLEALPPKHHLQADPLLALGKTLLLQNYTRKALIQARKALAINEYALPPGHRRTAEARCFLGAVLTAAKRYEEAEHQLLKSRDALQSSVSLPAQHLLLKVNKHLTQLYDAWGKPNLAAAYRDTLTSLEKSKSKPYR